MAKIENIIVYPTVTPAASDLLIATDVSDNNKTVTFLVSSLAGGGSIRYAKEGAETIAQSGIDDFINGFWFQLNVFLSHFSVLNLGQH